MAPLHGFSLALSVFVSTTVATTCKCLPGDSCFPTDYEWAVFAEQLSQPLISNQRPLASVCYTRSTNYDATLCAEVTADYTNALWIATQSNALQFPNFEELVVNDTILQCPFNPSADTVCAQGRVPSYSINVTTVADIQATVKFATEYDLHLVVKHTGHELLGRAFGVGSVELFMHNLQGIEFSDSFVPSGAPADTEGQYAVTIGAGVRWGDIYTAAEAQNRTIAGGFAPYGSVGAGAGWFLGVDNVLEVSVVLPNAPFITANSYQYPDLFWALRGGGGPSFGIVTSVTYKTHENIPYTAAYYSATAGSADSWTSLLQLWSRYHNNVSEAGWAGVWPFFDSTLYLTFVAQGAPPSDIANSTLEAFFEASANLDGVVINQAETVVYSSFFYWYYDNLVEYSGASALNYVSLFDQTSTQSATASWLIPASVSSSEANALAEFYASLTSGSPFMVAGGAVSEVNPDSVAVTPAWRTAISDFIVSTTWEQTTNASVVTAAQTDAHDQIATLRDLAPVPLGGQYVNEPDDLEEDWQTAYWGSHYDRLLAIKQEIDPSDLLIVYKGVNSELWDDQIICKSDD